MQIGYLLRVVAPGNRLLNAVALCWFVGCKELQGAEVGAGV
jgi:hypothetical protein